MERAPAPVLTTPPCLSPRPPADYGMFSGVCPVHLELCLLSVVRDRDRAGMAAEDTAPRRVPGSTCLLYPGLGAQGCDDDGDFDVESYYCRDGEPPEDWDLHPACSSSAPRWTTPLDSVPLGAPHGL